MYVGGVIGIIEQGLESSISVEGNKYTAVGKTSKVGEFETQPAKYGIGTGTDEPGCIDADEKPGGNPDTQAKPAFKNANLILSGQIGVNFFLDLPEISGVDYYNGESCYMAFDIKGNKTSNNPQPTDGTLKMGDYFGYRCYVNSVQMADPITADFHYGDGKTVSYVYTIQRYLDNGRENMAVRQSDGTYQVQIASISAHRLADTQTVKVTSAKDFTIKVSALTFVYTSLKGANMPEGRQKLGVALYR